MSFELKQLGPFKIERTEDYDLAGDKSYAAMIRVRGSKPKAPVFMVPSHLYKYSGTELALYMKDHKNLWRPLGKLLNEDVDVSDEEIILIFPVSRFAEVAKIVPFMRKRGLAGNSELAKVVGSATQFRKNTRHKTGQTDSISEGKESPL
jgi:hypothetical protein